MNLNQLSARDIAKGIRSKKFKAKEVTQAALAAVKKEQKALNSYITILEEFALRQSEEIDKRVEKGNETGSLSGVPIAIKDNLMIKGSKTTCASKILGGYIAPYNAFVIEKLQREGAIFIGKTNLDEFAMGSSTEFSSFGRAKNPWDKECIPGGSSGGSAVTVASRSVPISLGSDTGGSIRQPASFCGVLGFKPTYGRVSRYGLVAFASSLDQIGPFTHNTEDLALALSVLCGHDTQDSTSVDQRVPNYDAELKKNVKGLKVGIPKEYFIEGMDPEVEKTVRNAGELLKKLGAKLIDISLPTTEAAVAAYYVLAPSEASSNLARFDGMRYGFRNESAGNLIEQYNFNRRDGFGPEVKRRIMIGTYSLSSGYYDAYYSKAQRVRTLIKNDFEKAFEQVDVILTPTSPTPAFKAGEKLEDPLQMYLSDVFSIPANLAGIPGLSVPGGFSSKGLPIGVQFLAKAFQDEVLIRVSNGFLNETKMHLKYPQNEKARVT